MRILLLTSWYPSPERAVSGIFIRDQAEALRAAGDDVLVLHVPDPEAGPTPLWRVEQTGEQTFCLHVRRVQDAFQTFLAVIATLATFRRLYSGRGAPDVVHAHTDRAAVLGAAVATVRRLPLFITEHSTVFLDRDPFAVPRRRAAAAAWAMQRARRIFPVGPALRDALRELAPSAAFEVLPEMVDTDFFDVRAEAGAPFHFVTVGLLTEQKGIETLLAAFALVCHDHPQARLTIVGEGPLRRQLEKLAGDLALTAHVCFVGQRTREQIRAHLLEASVFVSPSRYETFGLAAAEGLATGMPVVTTKSGGPESFIDSSCGAVVDIGDVDALARAMSDVARGFQTQDPAEVARRGRAYFSRSAVVAALRRAYTRATNSTVT